MKPRVKRDGGGTLIGRGGFILGLSLMGRGGWGTKQGSLTGTAQSKKRNDAKRGKVEAGLSTSRALGREPFVKRQRLCPRGTGEIRTTPRSGCQASSARNYKRDQQQREKKGGNKEMKCHSKQFFQATVKIKVKQNARRGGHGGREREGKTKGGRRQSHHSVLTRCGSREIARFPKGGGGGRHEYAIQKKGLGYSQDR